MVLKFLLKFVLLAAFIISPFFAPHASMAHMSEQQPQSGPLVQANPFVPAE
jgi:hypothetical protein